MSCAYTGKWCDDKVACTTDGCDSGSGQCFHKGQPSLCDDGNKCTIDNCNSQTGCVHFAETCNDGNPCTADGCQHPTGCVYTPIGGPGCGGSTSGKCGADPQKTCSGLCGAKGVGNCYCDSVCKGKGDCCPDFSICGCK